MLEGLAMIGVIVAWWPLLFLGWTAVPYRVGLYVGSFLVLGIILYRRWSRLQEGFRHSQRIIDQQQLMRHGPTPPLTLHSPPEITQPDGDRPDSSGDDDSEPRGTDA